MNTRWEMLLVGLLMLACGGCATMKDVWRKIKPTVTPTTTTTTTTLPPAPVEPGLHSFLWKPIAESTGKLVILLPCDYRPGQVASVLVSGNVTESKAPRSETANGDRLHAFLSRPGADFGANITISAIAPDGSVLATWHVADGSQRSDGRD